MISGTTNFFGVKQTQPSNLQYITAASGGRQEPSTSLDYKVEISAQARHLIELRGVSADERAVFQEIVREAQGKEAGAASKSYLNSLSSKQMDILRRVHSLAHEINIGGLDHEGAFNLLRMPDDYLDLDGNGLHQVGLGRSRVFPPADAPASVHRAYKEAFASIGGDEGFRQIIARAPFLAAEISRNIKLNQNGTPIGVYRNDEPGYTEIYRLPGFSYSELLDNCLADLEVGKENMGNEYYSATKRFLEVFKHGIEKYSAGS